jgi:hypothetical protein
VGRSVWGHDLCNISFCYLLLLHGGPEHGMNKAVLSSKCIHSFNKFLKIMERLLSNEEIIHSQGSVQIQKAKVVLGIGMSVAGAHLCRKVTCSTQQPQGSILLLFAQSNPCVQINNAGRKLPFHWGSMSICEL